MPLYKKIVDASFQLAIWQIDEPASFFETAFRTDAFIQHEHKRLQWYASRFLAKELLGHQTQVINNEIGKPQLHDSEHAISISHCIHYAAVIIGNQAEVGVDVEPVHRKVERVAHKFLTTEELEAIGVENRIEKLILYWSVKEALYKLHGEGGIDFKTQLLVKPFELNTMGALSADIITTQKQFTKLAVHYEFFNGHVLTYVTHRFTAAL